MGFRVPKGINKVPFSIRVDENDFEQFLRERKQELEK